MTANRLKLALVADGRPQYAIADIVGVSETRISRLANGRGVPSPEERRRIADALGVPEPEIFGESERPHR